MPDHPASSQDRPRTLPKKRRPFRWLVRLFFGWLLLSFLSVGTGTYLGVHENRLGRNQSAELAPEAEAFPQPIIQVYGARTRGAKRTVSVHTWIAVKRKGAPSYTTYEIIGWRLRRGGTALVQRDRVPDQSWYGSRPDLLLDLRGDEAEPLIDQVEAAVASYPYKDTYTAWPGPNSNTFTAHVGHEVPALGLDLPSTAIGKDYRPFAQALGASTSGTGIQLSLWGVLGVALSREEGLVLNLLGLNTEIDLFDRALELPGIGRLGRPPAGAIN